MFFPPAEEQKHTVAEWGKSKLLKFNIVFQIFKKYM